MNQLAKRIVDEATGKEPITPPPAQKNQAAVELGRLGGKIGGNARAKILSVQRRSEIARIAAAARWNNSTTGGHMALIWSKQLTDSDAQQDTEGSKMPFLRFTQGSITEDYKTWFRSVFFANIAWSPATSRNGHRIEKAQINIHVVILGQDKGIRTMSIDHDPARAANHSAPTTHLHYDNVTRRELESQNLSARSVVVKNENGVYSLVVQ